MGTNRIGVFLSRFENQNHLAQTVQIGTRQNRVITCVEKLRFADFWCCVYCSRAPKFETFNAKNNNRLAGLIDNGNGTGSVKVEEKFSELHEKLEKNHVHPGLWTVPIVLFCIVGIFKLVLLQAQYRMKCGTSNICSLPTYLVIDDGYCPHNSDWAINCCYAFCTTKQTTEDDHIKRSSEKIATGYGVETNSMTTDAEYSTNNKCYRDTNQNDNIRKNMSFSANCNCRFEPVGPREDDFQVWHCGSIKIYGDVIHWPGVYATPRVTGLLIKIVFVFMIMVVILGVSYTGHRRRKINDIILCHFQDWGNKGIEIAYQPPKWVRKVGFGNTEHGHLTLTLPPL